MLARGPIRLSAWHPLMPRPCFCVPEAGVLNSFTESNWEETKMNCVKNEGSTSKCRPLTIVSMGLLVLLLSFFSFIVAQVHSQGSYTIVDARNPKRVEIDSEGMDSYDFSSISSVQQNKEESVSTVQSQNRIFVHCHSPEGKEIGSILRVDHDLCSPSTPYPDDWNPPVYIYKSVDGESWTFIGHGSCKASDHPKRITISGDVRKIKVTFNGMEVVRDVTNENNQTLEFVFTRDLETFDFISFLDSIGTTSQSHHREVEEFFADETYSEGWSGNGCSDQIRWGINFHAHTGTYSSSAQKGRFVLDGDFVSTINSSSLDLYASAFSSGEITWKQDPAHPDNYEYYSSVYVGVSEGYQTPRYVNIPQQGFDNWYVQFTEIYNYPGLLWTDSPRSMPNLSHRITPRQYPNPMGPYFGTTAAVAMPYLFLYDYTQGGTNMRCRVRVSSGARTWGRPGDPPYDNSGFKEARTVGWLEDLHISCVPYDMTGTAVGEEDQLPVASFTYAPENPVVYEEITFDASSSYDPF